MSDAEEDELNQVNARLIEALKCYKETRSYLLQLMERQKELMTKPPHIKDNGHEPPETRT